MMGKSTLFDDENGIKKGPWTPEEDQKLRDYIEQNGHGSWRALPKLAGLNRCGKSCRLRWTNYLRPDIKRGKFSEEEEQIIINYHAVLGNKWSAIAQNLPGRTDNEIKNYWNTHLRKKLLQMGIDPVTHRPRTDHLNLLANLPQLLAAANFSNLMNNIPNNWDINNINALRLQPEATTQLAKLQLLNSILQVLSTNPVHPNMEAANILLGSNHNFRDHQVFELLSANSQLEGLLGGSLPAGFPPSQDQLAHHHVHQLQPRNAQDLESIQAILNDSKSCNIDQFFTNYLSSSSSSQLPSLVSASPDQCSTLNQVESKVSPNDGSNPSSTSTTFEALGDLMDDDGSETYWRDIRDIIDQASPHPWQN